MKIVSTPAELRAAVAVAGRPLGFVPTMGALHAGHFALLERARAECETLVASIFVNPLQFGDPEDFANYPGDRERDVRELAARRVDFLYAPEHDTMFARDFSTSIDVGPLADVLEGAQRPGHFRGVATIVAKLLNAAGADRVYFGEKDAQQVAVIRKLVRDLDFPVELVLVPTVREPDGLALSSRNTRLNAAEREAAPTLHSALQTVAEALTASDAAPAALAAGRARLAPLAQLEYLEIVDADTFLPAPDAARRPLLIVAAARFGATRLIDNIILQ